jgi:hypothetical protein
MSKIPTIVKQPRRLLKKDRSKLAHKPTITKCPMRLLTKTKGSKIIANRDSSSSSSSDDDSTSSVEYISGELSDTVGIKVMYKGMRATTKKYPCRYCTDNPVFWTTRIQEHFRSKHVTNVLVKEVLEKMAEQRDTHATIEDKLAATRRRRIVEILLLNSSTFLHNRRVIAQKRG